jgi:hypothetical protein
VTTHSRTLTGLTPNTLYHYRINSTDASGNTAITADLTFTTTVVSPNLLVFDWNTIVTKKDHRGFPWNQPPMASANGDWTAPINYAEGTLYMRAEVRSQPVSQSMKLQFCIWQYSLTLESCTPMAQVQGTPGTVVTWSIPIANMPKKNGVPIDWKNPRQRYGIAIKNSAELPVSDLVTSWNWNGENPDEWYPLDLRFTVVVVPKNKTFIGWNNFIQ